ncbi:dihydrofolate reductase [Sulfurivirga sp.]|uniref:dihydrofolate reductase n=1 Tax=Sulfurivirga sp. TaxID=2614236 RepID=UPI0025E1FDE4|nr:dihydrofolate reductase [Sulfurivirga sp.]
MISLIAAMDRNRAIGRGNALPWHLPDDLKHFKRLTLGKPVIMGRRTFESLGCRPLPQRPNFVVSRSGLDAEGVTVLPDLDEAVAAARATGAEEIMIIGGAQIYRQMLDWAERIYLTLVETEIDGADAWFPMLPEADWQLVGQESHPADERHPWPFHFQVWHRKAPQ